MDELERKVQKYEERTNNLESRLENLEKTIEKLTLNYSCDKCELIFRNESQLTKHTTETHVNKRSVTEEEYVSPSNLTEDQDKVFQCENCNFKTSSEHGLKIHKTKKHSQFSSNLPVQNRGQFSPRCPPRFPPKIPPKLPP